MTLPDIIRLFPTDASCRELLERLRWPKGPVCLRCSGKVIPLGERLYYCSACRYQFAVTTGTIFADTHLDLEKWFLAVLLLCEARKGMSAKQLQRTLGTGYKTAWYLCHRIRAAMATAARPPLSGVVEMDETYIGGKETSERPGRPKNSKKEIVIGVRQRGGDLRFFRAEDVKSGTIERYERGIIGSWHKVSAKHLMRYLAEMEFRFNRRNRSDLFVDTLRHMVTADPLSFADLVK